MRAITGSITSSRPISLSKAASVLSRFASSETCATPEISAYLQRSAEAFNELVEYHRGFKVDREKRKEESRHLGRCEDGLEEGGVLVTGDEERCHLERHEGRRKKEGKGKVDALDADHSREEREEDGGRDNKRKKEKKKKNDGGEEQSRYNEHNGEDANKCSEGYREKDGDKEMYNGYCNKKRSKKKRVKDDVEENGEEKIHIEEKSQKTNRKKREMEDGKKEEGEQLPRKKKRKHKEVIEGGSS